MAKSGKERKQRRGARQDARAEVEAALVDEYGSHWGSGEHESNALIRRSLRWNTPSTGNELDDLSGQALKAATNHDIAMKVTRTNMLSGDGALSNAAIRNLIAMEAQNQRDDLGELTPSPTSIIPQTTNIENAQIIFNVPDNGRGPDRALEQ